MKWRLPSRVLTMQANYSCQGQGAKNEWEHV
jgi:hypothetical protein